MIIIREYEHWGDLEQREFARNTYKDLDSEGLRKLKAIREQEKNRLLKIRQEINSIPAGTAYRNAEYKKELDRAKRYVEEQRKAILKEHNINNRASTMPGAASSLGGHSRGALNNPTVTNSSAAVTETAAKAGGGKGKWIAAGLAGAAGLGYLGYRHYKNKNKQRK